MRKLYKSTALLCAMILWSFASDAQTFFTETFDNTSLPAGWSMSGTGNSGWEFTGNPGYNMSGTQDHTGNGGRFAWQDGSSPSGINAWMQTDITIPTGQTAILEFYQKRYKGATTNPHNTFTLQVNDGSGFTTLFTWAQNTSGNDWQQHSVGLTGYSGTVTVRFNVQKISGSAFYDDVAIDDVTAYTIPDPTGATASATNVCAGASVTLTGQGITGTAEWFTGSCGGTSIGTGTSITVNPTAASTTYYVNNNVNNTASANCASVTVTTTPSGITNAETIVDATCNVAAIGYAPDGSISVSTSVGAGGAAVGPFTYDWSNGVSTTGTSGAINSVPAGTYTVTVSSTNNCADIETYTVTDPGVVLTAGTSTGVSCNGLSDGTATLSFSSGGVPDYNYTWPSGLSGTATPSSSVTDAGLSAGTYTITVTDQNNCQYEPQINVSQPAALANTSTVTDALCNENDEGTYGFVDQTITGGTTPYSYAWSNGDSVQDLTNTAAGVYVLTITDANGCVFVTNPDTIEGPMDITMNLDSIVTQACFGDEQGFYAVTANGGTGLPTFYDSVITSASTVVTTVSQGTPMGNGADADGKNQFVYTASELQAAGFTAGEIRKLGFEVASAGDPLTNFSIALKLSTGNTNFNGYIVPTASYSFETGFSTVYNDDVTPQNGWNIFNVNGFMWDGTSDIIVQTCYDNLSAGTASPVTATITSDNYNAFGRSNNVYNNCANEGFDNTTQIRPILYVEIYENNYAYTYDWSHGETDTISDGLAAGDYTVTITDQNNCEHYDTVSITEPDELVANPMITDLDCNGDNSGSVDAGVTGGTMPYNYTWDNGASTASITGLAADTFTVTVTDDSNCVATALAVVNQPSPLVANVAETEDVKCEGDESGMASVATSGGTPEYTYSWDNGSTDAMIEGVSNGTYTVTVTDGNGCTEVVNATINAANPLPNVDLGPDQSVGAGTVLTLDAGLFINYMWNNNMNFIGQSVTWLVESDTTLVVEVLDANGCSNSDTININVLLGTSDIQNNINVRYFPNPTSGIVNVEFEGMNGENVDVQVMNVQGQVIMLDQFNQAVNGKAYQLDLTNEAKGVYFIKLNSDNKSSIHKVTLR